MQGRVLKSNNRVFLDMGMGPSMLSTPEIEWNNHNMAKLYISVYFLFSRIRTAMYVHDTNPVSDGCLVFWFDTSH